MNYNQKNNLQKFNIRVIEKYSDTYEVEATSFDEACDILNDEIIEGEITSINADSYERQFEIVLEKDSKYLDEGYGI